MTSDERKPRRPNELRPVKIRVLEADGGTRTVSVTGGFLARIDALHAVRRELPDPRRWPVH